MHAAPPAPLFTSAPVTAAAQGSPYSYQVRATDPSGGTVTYTLTTAPTGATLTGNTLAWTPAASQSRISNSFTVTATTSEGGSAAQSWTVSPSGTVTVNTLSTFWTPTGPVTLSDSAPFEEALVLNADGSVTALPGSATAPGVFSIPNVPAGYYWLLLGLNADNLFNAFWTSASTFDAGRNALGAPTPIVSSPQTTTFNFSLTGLDTASAPDTVVFMTDGFIIPPVVFPAANGAQTLNAIFATNFGPYNVVDWSQINTALLLQYEPVSFGSLNSLVLGPELTLTNLSFTNGATNSISDTLQPSPQASLSISVPGSQWAPLFDNTAASTVTPLNSWLSVSAEPYVVGANASAGLLAPNLYLLLPELLPGLGSSSQWPGGRCAPGLPTLPSTEPPILTDQNFGTVQYGDPFPSSWTRAVSFCQQATVLIPVNGSLATSFPFAFEDGESVPPSNSPLAPLVSQVQNATINGASLFTAGIINTTSVTLSWSAPATGTPYGYSIVAFQVIPLEDGVEFATAGTFGTAKTSITLPPLAAGKTYIFVITAQVDGTANIEASPYRSSLPTAFATVVSAPITINTEASRTTIHGDAGILKLLSEPRYVRKVSR